MELRLRTKASQVPLQYPELSLQEKNGAGISFLEKNIIISHWSYRMALHDIILFKLIWANKYKCVYIFTVLETF